MKHKYYIWPLVALSLALGGCKRDDNWSEEVQTETASKKEFKVLSVRSYEEGRAVSLSLDLSFEDDALRSLQYSEDATTGALSSVAVGDTERVHLFLRRDGDASTTTMATLTWQGRTGNRLTLPSVMVNLPQGVDVNPGETWHVAAVLGGELDASTGKVALGKGRDANGRLPLQAGNIVDMPYSFGWQQLSIDGQNKAHIPLTAFRPLGAMLRLQFYSDMIDDYDASYLEMSSNALRASGTLDILSTSGNQAVPIWEPEQAESATPVSWVYSLGGSGKALTLPAGKGWSTERTIFVWAMPTSTDASATKTSISLGVRNTALPSAPELQATTYTKQGHRALKSGSTYRLSNVLTSEPLISEIYYQYVPRAINTEAPTANRNYSIVEIYNPTTSPIDLTKYALARVVLHNGTYVFFAGGNTPNANPAGATVVPLSVVGGSSSGIVGFANNRATYSGAWYKSIYGTASTTLEPGKTLLVGAAGYVHTDNKPSRNIELFTQQLSNGTYTSTTSIRDLEKVYYPRAGMQADSAVRAGYAQAMVAIDNSGTKDRDPNPQGVGGVLQLGNGQGIALLKATAQVDASTPYSIEVVDTSIPLGDATQASAYRSELLSRINASGESMTTLDLNATMSYSLVRASGDNFANPSHRSEAWLVATTENDGVKSIGSRHYVAGLTPYAKSYTGYDATNNPKGNPFWSSKTFASPATKDWGSLLETGQNTFDTGMAAVEGRYSNIAIASAQASEEQANYRIGNSYDGNSSTFYHSNNRGGVRFPVVLTYDFARPETLEHIIYHPRDKNGSFNAVDVVVTYEDGTTATYPQTLGSPEVATRITWSGISSKKITRVSFRVNSTYYGVVSVREMEFVKISDNYFDTSTIFSDVACTTLRPGITYTEIMAIPNTFFREMARRMYQGTYPREFRIAQYKSYPDPSLQRTSNKTQFLYSQLDNPTGISVRQGDELVVLVDNPSGRAMKLRVQDLSVGYGDATEYTLVSGINKIKTDRKGLLYIKYQSSDAAVGSLQDATVHIAGGTVNGYYDAQNPSHRGRWRELLSKATDQHFDVLGRYAHITYPTSSFRNNTPDGDELIGLYDKVVLSEMELMGLVKYGKTFKNRMYFHVIYGSGYMYATNYRTAYHSNTMTTMTTPSIFREWPWGVAHEVGHINQTVGLNWGCMIETTNNIKSFYIEHIIFGLTSRTQKGTSDWYTTAWNALFGKSTTLSAEARASNALIPYIQLELYLGQVLGQSPSIRSDKGGFYPDLYERLRVVNASVNNTIGDAVFNGNQQADLAYHASVAANLDLTDFFEQWGFLRPADNVEIFDTYGKSYRITLTEAKINEVKTRIRSLGLQKPALRFEYITPNNIGLYRSPGPVGVGTSTRSDKTFTFTGWSNVVAWEVVDASDNLLYTYTGWRSGAPTGTYTFTLPVAWDASYKVRAIAANGARTQVVL